MAKRLAKVHIGIAPGHRQQCGEGQGSEEWGLCRGGQRREKWGTSVIVSTFKK